MKIPWSRLIQKCMRHAQHFTVRILNEPKPNRPNFFTRGTFCYCGEVVLIYFNFNNFTVLCFDFLTSYHNSPLTGQELLHQGFLLGAEFFDFPCNSKAFQLRSFQNGPDHPLLIDVVRNRNSKTFDVL